jgi:peptidoglycan/LPS O-acetylase OafA/YrhL
VKLREIERLRGVAVMMAVLTHTAPFLPYLGGIFSHPRTGVDIFFVISGFVVTRSLIRLLPDVAQSKRLIDAFDESRFALRTFYTRRFFRIAPLAVAVVALQGILFWIGFSPAVLGGDFSGYVREVCAIFMGVYNYALPNEGYTQFGVFWSLSIEEHFYLLLPVAFLLFRTREQRLAFSLAGIAFVACVCRNFFDVPPEGTAVPDFYRVMASHLRFDHLLAGVALALVFDGSPATPFMPKAFMKWVVLPMTLALIWVIPKALPSNTYFHEGFVASWFLCGILVAYAALDRGYVLEIPLLGRLLEYVGSRSYGVYLLHIPVLRLDNALLGHAPRYRQLVERWPWGHWFLYAFGTVMLAELTWHILESPMQRLGRRLTRVVPVERDRSIRATVAEIARSSPAPENAL